MTIRPIRRGGRGRGEKEKEEEEEEEEEETRGGREISFKPSVAFFSLSRSSFFFSSTKSGSLEKASSKDLRRDSTALLASISASFRR
jgi:hypothetical protein